MGQHKRDSAGARNGTGDPLVPRCWPICAVCAPFEPCSVTRRCPVGRDWDAIVLNGVHHWNIIF